MTPINQSHATHRMVADAAVGFSAAGSSFAWLSVANEILTAITALFAIAAAVLAARYHVTARRQLLEAEAKTETEEQND